MQTATAPSHSIWQPLSNPVFRAIWIASVASSVGTWVHDVGAEWLMTSLAPSPMMVALVQTAEAIPIFMLALPAGAIADIVDRRRVLLFTQTWMMLAAITLGVLTLAGLTGPWVLLALTFAISVGVAVNTPAWQSLTPEIVDRSQLPAALTLNSVGFNLSRLIGPALGGLIIAAARPGTPFLVNSVSFLAIIAVLSRWRHEPKGSIAPTERLIGAMKAGLRYSRHSRDLRSVLVRTGLFIFCGNALWALLPLLARREAGLSAVGYGSLIGFLGAGAITGAMVLPRLRARLPLNTIVFFGTMVFAAVLVSLAFFRGFAPLCATMLVGGTAWMAVMSSVNIAAQSSVPAWVRSRALAVYMLVFQGGAAVGSVAWGAVATHAGIPNALRVAAGGLVLGLGASARYRLLARGEQDLSASSHWPEPEVAVEPGLDDGPVLVTVEYRVEPDRAHDFAQAMCEVGITRRRDGAFSWGVFADLSDPGRYLEVFMVESWAEHLRQHSRVTVADRDIEGRARAFHVGGQPRVGHLISVYAGDEAPPVPPPSAEVLKSGAEPAT